MDSHQIEKADRNTCERKPDKQCNQKWGQDREEAVGTGRKRNAEIQPRIMMPRRGPSPGNSIGYKGLISILPVCLWRDVCMEVYVYVCRSVCDYMYRCVSVNVHVRCVCI